MQVLKEEVRQAIIDAARVEFTAKGFHDAGMRAIAERAGFTAGNLYRYFPDKEKLFAAIVNEAEGHEALVLLAAVKLRNPAALMHHLRNLDDDTLTGLAGGKA